MVSAIIQQLRAAKAKEGESGQPISFTTSDIDKHLTKDKEMVPVVLQHLAFVGKLTHCHEAKGRIRYFSCEGSHSFFAF